MSERNRPEPTPTSFDLSTPVDSGAAADLRRGAPEGPRPSESAESLRHRLPDRRGGGADRPTTSLFVYGESRPLVNLVLYAFSDRTHPDFHWFDVRGPSDAVTEPDPARLGWVDRSRLWEIDQFEGLAADNARANAAVFELVRSDEPPEVLARLADLLRLPRAVREILAAAERSETPALLAVANADRLARSFPDSTLSSVLEAFEESGCSLFVGATESDPLARRRFTHVVRVEGSDVRRWAESSIVLESTAPFAALSGGRRFELSEVDFLARVLRRAHGSA